MAALMGLSHSRGEASVGRVAESAATGASNNRPTRVSFAYAAATTAGREAARRETWPWNRSGRLTGRVIRAVAWRVAQSPKSGVG